MQKFVNQLYRKYLKELRVVNRHRSPRMGVGNSEMSLSRTCFQKLGKYIAAEGFKNEEEEIHFFKELLPPFHALYIFHVKMEVIEQHFITEQLSHKRLFLEKIMRVLRGRLNRQAAFSAMVSQNRLATNRRLFLRTKAKVKIPEEYALLQDYPLCTAASLKLAEIIACNLLLDYWGDLARQPKTSMTA